MAYGRGVGRGEDLNREQIPGAWAARRPDGFDNFDAPPMDRGQPQRSQERYSFAGSLSESQPGHFPDLSKFARCDRDGVHLEGHDAENARSAALTPGDIIRIRDVDSNSRLHNRVMLVIRANTSGSSYSLTCLTFCRHSVRRTIASEFADNHARVICARTGHVRPDDVSPHLKVFVGRDDLGFIPEPEVWLNIREIWNVDLQLAVAVLGEADPRSLTTLLDHVKTVFCNTIGNNRVTGTPQRGEPGNRRQNEMAVASSPEDNDGPSERRTKTYYQRRGVFGPIVKITQETPKGARHRQSG